MQKYQLQWSVSWKMSDSIIWIIPFTLQCNEFLRISYTKLGVRILQFLINYKRFFFSWYDEVLKLHEVDEVPCAIPCKIRNLVCSLIYVIGVLNIQQLSDFLHLLAPERSLVRVKDFASTNYETFTGRWRYMIINTDYKTLKSGFQVNKVMKLFIFCVRTYRKDWQC